MPRHQGKGRGDARHQPEDTVQPAEGIRRADTERHFAPAAPGSVRRPGQLAVAPRRTTATATTPAPTEPLAVGYTPTAMRARAHCFLVDPAAAAVLVEPLCCPVSRWPAAAI